MLLCKETCKQPFQSYRLVGGGDDTGIILRNSGDMTCKRTVLAYSNLALLSFAVDTMSSHPDISMSFLRGRGEVTSRINELLRLIKKVYKLWTGEITDLSKMAGFERSVRDDDGDSDAEADADAPADADADADAGEAQESADRHGGKSEAWRAFCAEAETREMSDQVSAISFVQRYKGETPSTIEDLKEKLKIGKSKRKAKEKGEDELADSDPETENKECTILLSTIHGAKGLEWDTVQVLDDLAPLAAFRVDVDKNSNTPTGSLWCEHWNDQALNLW